MTVRKTAAVVVGVTALVVAIGSLFMLETFARTWQAVAAERHSGLDRFVAPPATGGASALDLGPLRLTPTAVASGFSRTSA